MKRLKFLLLAGILACMIGCQNQNDITALTDGQSVENIEDNNPVSEESKKNESVEKESEVEESEVEESTDSDAGENNSISAYKISDEDFYKLVSYLIYLEGGNNGLPEDIICYEIVFQYGDRVDNSNSESDVYRIPGTSHKMLTSDLNIFLKDVLKSDKEYDAGYRSVTEAGIYCEDDGFTYAYNGVGWGEYAVIKNVVKTLDSIDIEADIMNGYDGSLVNTIKFSLKESDNKFGYSIDRDSISIH
jgi:hypothetical protein